MASNVSRVRRRPQRTIPNWSRRPDNNAATAIGKRLDREYRFPALHRRSATDASACHRLLASPVIAGIRDPILPIRVTA